MGRRPKQVSIKNEAVSVRRSRFLARVCLKLLFFLCLLHFSGARPLRSQVAWLLNEVKDMRSRHQRPRHLQGSQLAFIESTPTCCELGDRRCLQLIGKCQHPRSRHQLTTPCLAQLSIRGRLEHLRRVERWRVGLAPRHAVEQTNFLKICGSGGRSGRDCLPIAMQQCYDASLMHGSWCVREGVTPSRTLLAPRCSLECP